MSRPLCTPRRDDRGFTLVELLVSMSLFALLGLFVVRMVVGGMDASADVQARTRDTLSARVAIDDLTKLLRVAADPDRAPGSDGPLTAFVSAGPTDVTFYANVDNKDETPNGAAPTATFADSYPAKVRLWVDSATRTLRSQVTPAVQDANGNWSWPGSGSVRILATGVVVPPPQPVFTYLSLVKSPDGTSSWQPLAMNGASLPAESLNSVDGVQLALLVQGSAYSSRPVTVISQVTLPN